VTNYYCIILITGSPALPVLLLLSGPKMGFSPCRGDTLPW